MATQQLVRRIAVLAGVLLAVALAAAPTAGAACASPANAIVAENCKPGTPPSDWDIAGGRQPEHPGLRDRHQRRPGPDGRASRSTPRRATTASTSTGWASTAATGRAWSRTVQPACRCRSQPACNDDGATGLIDCGNWATSASWSVPADATSRASTSRTSCARTARRREPHRLRRPRRRRPLGPAVPDVGHDVAGLQPVRRQQPVRRAARHDPGRAYKVSYNRPFTTRGDVARGLALQRRVPDGPLAGAQRLRRQLLHGRRHRPAAAREIREHRAFLSVGHDEYWSGQQRANVEAARDAGVNLAFFSGNEVFWKTRWEDRRTARWSPTRRRTRTRRSTRRGAWTGTWRDAAAVQPGGRAARERADGHDLHGQRGHDARSQVPAADGRLRLWRNTTVAGLGGRPDRDARRRTRRLRVGRGPRQRRPARRAWCACRPRRRNGVEVLLDYGLDLRRGHARRIT